MEAAYAELGIHPPRYRLGIPDGRVDASRDALEHMLAIHLAGAGAVVGPLDGDGAADQQAVAETVRAVAATCGVPVWQFAVWAREYAERLPVDAPCVLGLPAEVATRKQKALASFRSQTFQLGPGAFDGPVYPAGFLRHFADATEPLWPAGQAEGL